jgi:hypothetical protein
MEGSEGNNPVTIKVPKNPTAVNTPTKAESLGERLTRTL